MDLVEPSRGHRGSLDYHLHEQDDGRFFLYEVWRSKEDLDRHNATPLLRAFMDAVSEHIEGRPRPTPEICSLQWNIELWASSHDSSGSH